MNVWIVGATDEARGYYTYAEGEDQNNSYSAGLQGDTLIWTHVQFNIDTDG